MSTQAISLLAYEVEDAEPTRPSPLNAASSLRSSAAVTGHHHPTAPLAQQRRASNRRHVGRSGVCRPGLVPLAGDPLAHHELQMIRPRHPRRLPNCSSSGSSP
jgi:hypothetical protein